MRYVFMLAACFSILAVFFICFYLFIINSASKVKHVAYIATNLLAVKIKQISCHFCNARSLKLVTLLNKFRMSNFWTVVSKNWTLLRAKILHSSFGKKPIER